MSLHETMLNNARKLLGAGKAKEARAIIGEVLRTRPDSPEALDLSWQIAEQTQSFEESVRAYERAVQASPDVERFHYALGLALLSAGRFDAAVGPARRAIDLAPVEGRNHMLLGRILLNLGDADGAFASMRRATEVEPGVARIWYNFGGLLQHAGRVPQGIEALRRAIALDPGNPLYLAELGRALLRGGAAAEALDVLTRAQQIGPRIAMTAASLGVSLVEVGEGAEGVKMLRRAVDLDPGDREIRHLYVMNLNYVSDDGALMRREHRAFGERMEAAIAPLPSPARIGGSDRCIRVGFMSGDLRQHSCSHFLLPLFEGLNREHFQVVGVTTTNRSDAITEQFKRASDGWISIAGLPWHAGAQAIRDAGIDILIECAGHTDGSRLDVCAARPARVQMTFLGYPNTTGLTRVDYRLVDAITDPPGAEAFCEERLLRVPGCLWCFRPAPDAPEPGPAPALAAGTVTIGCFNSQSKFSAGAVEAWGAILNRIPRATFLVKNNRLHDPHTLARFRARFAAMGVSPDRVIAVPYTQSIADHLRVYDRIDFQVDTFPYNGTTTTCESLWQGVPVLAVRGKVHAAKVSESLLHAVGLDDWLADNQDGYVDRAVAFAHDVPKLAAVRMGLRARMSASALRDEKGYGERFGAALRTAWDAELAPNDGIALG